MRHTIWTRIQTLMMRLSSYSENTHLVQRHFGLLLLLPDVFDRFAVPLIQSAEHLTMEIKEQSSFGLEDEEGRGRFN